MPSYQTTAKDELMILFMHSKKAMLLHGIVTFGAPTRCDIKNKGHPISHLPLIQTPLIIIIIIIFIRNKPNTWDI